MLGESDIRRRLPVWLALTEVFLDTELQPMDYRWIAAELSASGYSPEELCGIFHREVAPAFLPNLMSVAGEWEPWSEAEVREIMLDYLEAGFARRAYGGARRWLFRGMLEEEWAKILEAMDRPLPESWLPAA